MKNIAEQFISLYLMSDSGATRSRITQLAVDVSMNCYPNTLKPELARLEFQDDSELGTTGFELFVSEN